MDLMYLLELAVNGGLAGLMYALVAMGIVLIYKSSSVPNLAQGGLTMLGAYIVLAFANGAGLPMWLAIPAAMATMFLAGIDIFVRATTMTIWGGSGRPMQIGISDAPLFLGSLLLNRAYVVGAVVSLVLFTAFMLFFRTRRGVVLRAIADDYTASWSVGISVERGVALSWALSSVGATTAGVLWGSVQTVDQTLAMLLLKGITVAVLGGMDSLGGAILAGLLLGILESVASGVLDPLLGGGTRELVVAAVLILTIMIRPHGLFGRHDIERV